MNTARIVVLVIALGAGGVSAHPASTYQDKSAMLAASRQSGTLQLALRSIVDANAGDNSTEDQAIKRAGGVSVIRYGVPARQLTSQK